MKNKVSLIITIVFFALAIGIQFTYGADKHSANEWKKYEGAWFQIMYPSAFHVKPSLKGTTSVKGHDSAFFVAPSKEVSFYVFSPQWNGIPSDILLNPKNEKMLSVEKSEKNGKKIRKYSIAAKDGSYYRIYEDTQSPKLNTRHVFGVYYKDKKILEKYKKEYKYFQNSLIQFAD